jgi:hypothetical protein
MLSTNFITITVDTNEEMTVKDFRQKIYEELKNVVSHTFRLKQGDCYVDDDVDASTSNFDDDEPITLEFTNTMVNTPNKTISRMNKKEIIEYLHDKFDWPKKDLKSYNLKELKTADKSGELPTDERDSRIASRKPRKVSGYMFWSNNGGRDKVKEENPELQPKEVMRKCGEIWRSMSDEEKESWNAKANPTDGAHASAPAKEKKEKTSSTKTTPKKVKNVKKVVKKKKKKQTTNTDSE